MTRKQLLLLALKLAVSGLLLWLVLTRVDIAGIAIRLRAADARWLIPVLVLGMLGVPLSAWRWKLLSCGLLSFGESVRYTWIGVFFGSVMPGVVGGDVAKGLSLAAKKAGARDSRLPMSIIVDKLIGFWILMLGFSVVATVLLIVQPNLLAGMRATLWTTCGATLAGLLAATSICHPRSASWIASLAARLPTEKLRSAVGRLLAAFDTYRGQGKVLLQAALLSILIHSLNAVSFWLVMRSLAIPASLFFAAVFYPLLTCLLALPVSVSGVGVRDVFAASMFTAFCLNPESGVAFSWLLLGLTVPNALIGGAIQLWEIFRRRSAD
mgnify:CR=1 FL=1